MLQRYERKEKNAVFISNVVAFMCIYLFLFYKFADGQEATDAEYFPVIILLKNKLEVA